jgi:hypothetical protein
MTCGRGEEHAGLKDIGRARYQHLASQILQGLQGVVLGNTAHRSKIGALDQSADGFKLFQEIPVRIVHGSTSVPILLEHGRPGVKTGAS